jgi:hypothetical protein
MLTSPSGRMGRGRQGMTLPCFCGGAVIGEWVKIPPGGSGQSHARRGNSGGSPVRFVQPRPAWGALDLVTGGFGSMTRPGVRTKHPTANSSTMRGGKPLAGKHRRRRCRTAKNPHRRVRGRFLVRSPEIARPVPRTGRRKLCPAGRPGHTMRDPKGNAF